MAGHRKSRFRGIPRTGWAFPFATAAFNLIRLSMLEEATP
ncbi:Mobile element protein [Azospirillum endophyticum]